MLKYSQKEKVDVEYKLEKQKGLEHQKFFLVAVFLNGKKIATAIANSKKEAEQRASKKAINKLL